MKINTQRLSSPYFLPAAAALISFVLYSSSLRNGFVYDDYLVLVDNPWVLTKSYLGSLFSQKYFFLTGEASYRPLVSLCYYVFTRVFGIQSFGFHFLSLLFHSLVTFQVTRFAQKLGLGRSALWVGTAFGLHPLLSEAVCGISFLEDPLCAFFIMTGVLLLPWRSEATDTNKTKSAIWRGLGLGGCLMLSCLAKESGLFLLLFIIFLVFAGSLWGMEKKIIRSFLLISLPAGILYGYLRFLLFPGPRFQISYLGGSPGAAIINTLPIFSSYLARLIYPLTLSVDRHRELIFHPWNIRFLGSLFVHGVLAISAILCFRRSPVFSLGVAWFYLALVPVANIVPLFHPEADRYTYLASVGFFLCMGTLLETFRKRNISRIMIFLWAALVLLWGTRTLIRVQDWENNTRLWQHEYILNPQNDKAITELAVQANASRDYPRAEVLARKSLALNPEYGLAQLQLAKSLFMQDKDQEALVLYLKAIHSGGLHFHHLSDAWFDVGYIFDEKRHSPEKAKAAYHQALRANPASLSAANNLGTLLAEEGDLSGALEVWKKALALHPDDKELQHNIEYASRALGKKPK